MKNSNPFIPQGSVLEHNKRRLRMKLAVGCVLAVSVAGLSAMLINGCTREKAPEIQTPAEPTNNFAAETNTNFAPASTNLQVPLPQAPTNTQIIVPPTPEATGTEYKIVPGDTLAKIAKAHGISLKALQAANQTVVPTKLKINNKITIPPAATPAPTTSTTGTDATAATTGGGETYEVKSGDTLAKIAKAHGVTLKALEAANSKVDPDHIKVKMKLNIPAKAEPAAPATVAAPVSAPVASPVTTLPSAGPAR
jgi:LysM repeat protein